MSYQARGSNQARETYPDVVIKLGLAKETKGASLFRRVAPEDLLGGDPILVLKTHSVQLFRSWFEEPIDFSLDAYAVTLTYIDTDQDKVLIHTKGDLIAAMQENVRAKKLKILATVQEKTTPTPVLETPAVAAAAASTSRRSKYVKSTKEKSESATQTASVKQTPVATQTADVEQQQHPNIRLCWHVYRLSLYPVRRVLAVLPPEGGGEGSAKEKAAPAATYSLQKIPLVRAADEDNDNEEEEEASVTYKMIDNAIRTPLTQQICLAWASQLSHPTATTSRQLVIADGSEVALSLQPILEPAEEEHGKTFDVELPLASTKDDPEQAHMVKQYFQVKVHPYHHQCVDSNEEVTVQQVIEEMMKDW